MISEALAIGYGAVVVACLFCDAFMIALDSPLHADRTNGWTCIDVSYFQRWYKFYFPLACYAEFYEFLYQNFSIFKTSHT